MASKQKLFEQLYKTGKETLKKGQYDIIERRARMQIQSSINEIENEIFEIVEKQKVMLSEPDKLDHIEFGKIEKTRLEKKAYIDILLDMHSKLFGDEYETTGQQDAWSYFN